MSGLPSKTCSSTPHFSSIRGRQAPATTWPIPSTTPPSKALKAHIETSEPGLVEKLVADLARICFETDNRISEVEISAEKPGAVTFTRSVGVAIHRTRPEVMGE